MNTIHLLKELERYSTFDLDTFTYVAQLDKAYAKVRLFRLKKAGYILELQRNSYTVHKDPLMVASTIIWPSYISYWYALNYHGLTYQLPTEISVLTTRKKSLRTIQFGSMNLVFYSVNPKIFFGFDRIVVRNLEIFMANKEKAIIDSILLNRISVQEIFEILQNNLSSLDLQRIKNYILHIGNISLMKRIGYMLDLLEYDLYPALEDQIYRTMIKLDPTMNKKGIRCPKWGILDNIMVRE